jgi:hypothetical protein
VEQLRFALNKAGAMRLEDDDLGFHKRASLFSTETAEKNVEEDLLQAALSPLNKRPHDPYLFDKAAIGPARRLYAKLRFLLDTGKGTRDNDHGFEDDLKAFVRVLVPDHPFLKEDRTAGMSRLYPYLRIYLIY